MAGLLRDATVRVEDPAEASTLLNKGSFGEARPGGGLDLTLIEATYLAESGRLEVTAVGGPVPVPELFRHGHSTITGFEVRYLVYRDLRQRGYIVKEAPAPLDFRVYPRGGAPKRTPSKYGIVAVNERSVFDLGGLQAHVRRAAGARKNLLLAVVDEAPNPRLDPDFELADVVKAVAELAPGLMQALDQIVGQERAVARHAHQPFDAVALRRQPVEPGQDAGERPDKVRHAVGHYGQPGVGEAFGVAIGVDDDAGALPGQCRQHAVEYADAADRDAHLVAAAHAAREAAGEHEAERGGSGEVRHQ